MSSPASPSELVPSEIVNREPDDADEDESPPMELLDAWKQVHERLTSAVLISQEAVAAKKLQRRYWMEEICANLTEDGKLTPSSVWKRAAPPSKKSAAKKMVSKKRKKAEPKQKKVAAKRKKVEKPPEQKTKETSPAEPKKKLTIRLKKPPVEPAPPPEEEEPVDQDDSQEASDEERNSDAEADTERTVSYSSEQQYNDSEGHESPPFGQGGPQWGPRQHDGYMVRRRNLLLPF
eukprot:scaffold22560_cov135-Cylindrotheca_fusiformis.AAC.30